MLRRLLHLVTIYALLAQCQNHAVKSATLPQLISPHVSIHHRLIFDGHAHQSIHQDLHIFQESVGHFIICMPVMFCMLGICGNANISSAHQLLRVCTCFLSWW
jgi:hypothetical protein